LRWIEASEFSSRCPMFVPAPIAELLNLSEARPVITMVDALAVGAPIWPSRLAVSASCKKMPSRELVAPPLANVMVNGPPTRRPRAR